MILDFFDENVYAAGVIFLELEVLVNEDTTKDIAILRSFAHWRARRLGIALK